MTWVGLADSFFERTVAMTDASRLPPHWLDDDIRAAADKRPAAIARALANSPRIQEAIRQGIADADEAEANGVKYGPGREQYIRQRIVEAIGAT